MMHTRFFLFLLVVGLETFGQGGSGIDVQVLNPEGVVITSATVTLHQKKDSSVLKVQVTDSAGNAGFSMLPAGDYYLRISHLGYKDYFTPHFFIPDNLKLRLPSVSLEPAGGKLSTVTVSARKPLIEMRPGRTIVNVESGISYIGTNVLEALEKMPGISIDKDGNISLKGKSGVTVLIDGRQTYLDPAQLSTLLSGMNTAQVSQVEIMDQPPSRYDAAGNAGVINIRLKKNTRKGFNGNVTTSFAQGVYPKNNNTLQLNYRTGKMNLFLSYGITANKNFTKIYALRKYFGNDHVTVTSLLEQPSYFSGSGLVNNLRTGFDYTVSPKTTAGITLSALALERKGSTNNTALWMDAARNTDSLIKTSSSNSTNWKNAGLNVNLRHAFTATQEFSVDLDRIGYRIRGDQFFLNKGISPVSYDEETKALIPSDINILSAKTDYTLQTKKWKLEAGAKTSHITTDNVAAYQLKEGTAWRDDLGRSNHFLYTENIHAVYGSTETRIRKWSLEGGLRYENTNYDARQLGNSVIKDSSFSRSYGSLFPTAFFSFAADSSHNFSLTAGRRIDRPAFQKLNPFVFIINKYTYQTGNPFFRPQYSWNLNITHSYKNLLSTSAGYSVTKDYISQLFPIDSNGIVQYTEGNLDHLRSFSASVSLQWSPASWWSMNTQVTLTHKKMEGVIGKPYYAEITQVHLNLNNQLHFKKGWTADMSGFYTSGSQNDIQEVLDPAGQLSLGVSRTILKTQGTIRLAARDVFYTQWMKGLTEFSKANEYFKLTRDSRVVALSFSYRFGKAFKAPRRSQGSATEEMERVGNG